MILVNAYRAPLLFGIYRKQRSPRNTDLKISRDGRRIGDPEAVDVESSDLPKETRGVGRRALGVGEEWNEPWLLSPVGQCDQDLANEGRIAGAIQFHAGFPATTDNPTPVHRWTEKS